MKRIPCSTILIRVLPASSAVEAERPDYRDKVYDSSRCQPTQIEKNLYTRRISREPLVMKNVLKKIESNELKVPENANEEQLMDFIRSRFGGKSEGPLNKRNLLSYNPEEGFGIRVEGKLYLLFHA
jgi:hypothetical protein